ncbi:hypothetical protein L484_002453 [Morus notabilis]|uniref:Uncharacterized protein n=2 Tax=Morus notabilis TaxID=981085 RepID=W9RSD8_9ROSA|nr:hypothetical protein L484_002453 [Morus notabilis]
MSDPFDDWECKFDGILSDGYDEDIGSDDDEVTESKIKDFFDDKALELRKLQTPLYDEFYNSLNAAIPSLNFSERQRKWKEELDQELEKKREMMHQGQASVGVKTSSPKDEAFIGRKRICK